MVFMIKLSLALFMKEWSDLKLLITDSTNNDYFNLPMGKLVESIYGDSKHTTLLPGNIVASAPTQPLAMSLLDSLTVHAKMRHVFSSDKWF